MDEYNIVEEIQKVLDGNGTISTATKDRLLLTAMRYMLIAIDGDKGIKDRLDYLEKYKPYLQGFAWAVGIIAASLLISLLTGQIQIVFTP